MRGWTTSALAERVGVSESTLFWHFSDKNAILAAAIRHQAGLLRTRIAAYEAAGTPWEQAEDLVLHGIDSLQALGGGPTVVLNGQVARVSPEIRRELLATRRPSAAG